MKNLSGSTIIKSVLLLIICLSVFAVSAKHDQKKIKHNKTHLETQMCYGPSVQTQDLNNSKCQGTYDPNVMVCWDNWFFHKYTLSVSAPQGWHFTGNPTVHCVQDNQGAFAWNAGYFNRIITTQSTPAIKEVVVGMSSRSVIINLQCEATKD